MVTMEKKSEVGRAGRVPQRTKVRNIEEWLQHQFRTRRSKLDFFRRVGLSYDKHGNPVVMPR